MSVQDIALVFRGIYIICVLQFVSGTDMSDKIQNLQTIQISVDVCAYVWDCT